jgi:hypothetical protein
VERDVVVERDRLDCRLLAEDREPDLALGRLDVGEQAQANASDGGITLGARNLYELMAVARPRAEPRAAARRR